MKNIMYCDDEDILEHLTVSDGKPQYIDSSRTKSQRTGKSKKQKTTNREEGTYERRPENRSANPSEGHYEEHYEKYEEYCIHQKRNVNQGVVMCDIDQDLTKCASCPYRKSQVIRTKVASASAKITKDE